MKVKGQGHPRSKVKDTKTYKQIIFAQFLGCKVLLVKLFGVKVTVQRSNVKVI